MKKFVLYAALFATTAHAQVIPSALNGANELSALPGGGWLALDKHALRLVDGNGNERARVAVRGRQFDVRGDLALVVDANAERALPVRIDPAGMHALPPLPDTGFGIEAACLYRDAQHLDHAFLIAKDGQAQQWLLGEPARLVRHMALPPHVKHCRVDDADATLYVSESSLGLWAYDADPESAGARAPVALAAPFGKLAKGTGALAVLPGGVAALDGNGTLHTWRRAGDGWRETSALPLAARALATGPRLLALTAAGWKEAGPTWKAGAPKQTALPIVLPRAQTAPVARAGDAADDPAIWIHPSDPDGARILGTNKKQGLLVYDVSGRQTQLLEAGRLNNVDVRQDLAFGDGTRVDLAMATQRDENAIVLFAIDGAGTVTESARLPTTLSDIYGACLHRTPQGGLDAIVNDKDGRFQQYRITRTDGKFGATLARSWRLASQPEGCVADERTGLLFMGEEKRGLWVADADATKPMKPRLVLPVGGLLHADVEGMGIYHGKSGSWIVVSSQGNDSYVVLDAMPPFAVRGAFRIGIDAARGIDGTSETDGLDVTSARLGGPYGKGLLVVQDGHKRLPDGPQNFKLVAWEDVAKALGLGD